MITDAHLLAIRHALVPGIDPTPIDDALAAWGDQPAVAVVGHVGVGKSTLLARLGARPAPHTGLGGVTKAATEHALPGGVVGIDTPGIDAEDRALADLVPVFERADVVVWVVDGLRPFGSVERRVLGRVPQGTAIDVVITRADLLDDADRDDVLHRVKGLAAPWRPRSVRAVDARLRPLPDVLTVPTPPPRPTRLSRGAVDAVFATLHGLPALPDPGALRARWQARWAAAVREAERDVAHEVRAGLVGGPGPAERSLVRHLRQRRSALLEALHGDPDAAVLLLGGEPAFPLPAVREVDPWRGLLAGLGGGAAALRAVREAAAYVLFEGHVAVEAWCPAADTRLEEARAARARLRALLHDDAATETP